MSYSEFYSEFYGDGTPVVPGDGSLWTFTPPTYNIIPPIVDDAPVLSNRLMRFFKSRPAGRNVWHLMDDTLTFDQPYPTIEDTPQNRAEGPAGQSGRRWTNFAPTYKRVYWGGAVYHLESSPDGTEIIRIAVFLIDNGYTPTDWLVGPTSAGGPPPPDPGTTLMPAYAGGYAGGYGG